MRFSKAFIPTQKEIPADATIPSHQLMLRAGLMRQLTAGVYVYLPLGYKAMLKAMQVVREEMNAIGGQEFHLPALNPESLWIQTGRRNVPNFILSIKERDLVLAPTHEEVIAWIASMHIQSYKDLPQIWYQIQTKFRNEPRPRSGVLRGRQFIMKDSYSLDASWEGLDKSYDLHAEAYRNTFTRCGIRYFVVGASSGAMGGTGSQEFMVEAPHGEDTVALCTQCDYAANLEIASSTLPKVTRKEGSSNVEEVHTPNVRTIDQLAEFLKVPHERLAKSVVYRHNGSPLLVLMVGNDQLNESKLIAALGGGEVSPMNAEALKGLTGADGGSIGPVNLKGFKIIADKRLEGANGLISGANRNDYHLSNIDLQRDVTLDGYYDLRTIEPGEACPKCGSALKVSNAIELGHIFKLGTKYSEALNVTFLDEGGAGKPVIMGSYGIGIERIVACAIEQGHDDNGIVWDKALAPYPVHVIAVNMNSKDVVLAANQVYRFLTEAGIEALFDDRGNVSPGFKFKDADLLGMPFQVIVGEKGLKNGQLEIKRRKTGERTMVAKDDVVSTVQSLLRE
ncbi:MAG: proline--tRNA ligase [Ignavibacteria bacterium GWA2_55_25]|nr:MAG: proline--tRNA ligase [Ignavibacteria bacterium GWA2_55_25]